MSASPPLQLPEPLQLLLGRWAWVLGWTAVFAAAAIAANLMRTPVYEARVEVAIGGVANGRWLQNGDELERRFDSLAQVASLADEALTPQEASSLSTDGHLVGRTPPVVGLSVRGPDPKRVRTLADGAARAVLADHRTRYDALTQARRSRVQQLRVMEERLEEALVSPFSRPPTLAGTSLALAREPGEPLVALAKELNALQAEGEHEAAAPSRLVAGPDLKQVGPRPGHLGSAAVGGLAGFILAALAALARRGGREPS